MSLQGKVALITGGGKNLGAGKHCLLSSHPHEAFFTNHSTETARELAKEKATLAIHYNSPQTKDATLKFVQELNNAGITTSVHSGDLTTAAACENLFQEVLATHGKVDILVNTVGMVLKKPIIEISESEYDTMFASVSNFSEVPMIAH